MRYALLWLLGIPIPILIVHMAPIRALSGDQLKTECAIMFSAWRALSPHMKAATGFLIAFSLSACTLIDEWTAEEPRGRQANYVESDFKSYMRSTPAGNILTSPDGMTVYTYDNEAAGTASCYSECADDWPPVLAPSGAKPFGDLTTVKRLDGTQEWAFRGKPLHFYSEDKMPGDVKGDNKDDLWHAVKR